MKEIRDRLQHVEITTDGRTAQVMLDGENVASRLSGFAVTQGINEPATLVLTYVCPAQMTIEGEFVVEHVCPRSARK